MKIDLNPSQAQVDEFARAASAARRRMFDAARNNSGSPPPSPEFDSLVEAVETLSSRLEALRNSVCVLPREAVTATRSRPDEDQDQDQNQNKDKPSPLGNDRPNIRPIHTSEKRDPDKPSRLGNERSIRPVRTREPRPSRAPGTEPRREAEEYVTSAEENLGAGRPRSDIEPIR